MARNVSKSKAICKVERQENMAINAAKKQMRSLADRLKELVATDPTMGPAEIEKAIQVLREYCFARAHDELVSDGPLTKESWQALSMSGMLQDQAMREKEHRQKMKQYEAGLDGLIQICYLGERPEDEDNGEAE